VLSRRNALLGMFAGLMVLVGLAPTARAADDATGTWTYTMPGRNNGPERKVTLKLKQDGEKLTGTINMGAGQNGAGRDVEITDGKAKDGEVSWKVVRKGRNGGDDITTTYTAKVTGDTMKGKSEGTFGGQARSRDFEAKKSKE